MSLDPEFIADCPYGPDAIGIDEIVEIDKEAGIVRATMTTHPDLPLTRDQRAHPVRHPRHVSGGFMVHLTGMLGFMHAYYVLGLRHADGWIGYGGRIYDARFVALAKMGPPLDLQLRATKVRQRENQVFGRYEFLFTQDGALIYQGDQAAMWMRVTEP
ncbi:MAG: hypothetical protein WCF10_00645 [Polyangiales bacterium]